MHSSLHIWTMDTAADVCSDQHIIRKEKKRKEKKRKEKKRKEKKRKEKKRKEKKRKTTAFGVNLMRSQVLYRAAQAHHQLQAGSPVAMAELVLANVEVVRGSLLPS
jgi:FKBP-type peptidyl-prolyl cis-trans isomerase